MTINTSSYTPPFTQVLPAWQDICSDYLSALTAPIGIIPQEVINMVDSAGEWYDLGLKLGFTPEDLNTIVTGYGCNQIKAAGHMLVQWINTAEEATPAALCYALNTVGLNQITGHISGRLEANPDYFCLSPQSPADTRDAPAPMVNPGYYGDNSQLPPESRPAFIYTNPPLPQQCVTMMADAAGQQPAPENNPGYYGDNSQLPSESRPAFIYTNPPLPQQCVTMRADAAGQQPAPENITSYFSNPPHSSAGIRPPVINTEYINQTPQECRILTGDSAGYQSRLLSEQLKRMKSELNSKDQQLSYRDDQLRHKEQQLILMAQQLREARQDTTKPLNTESLAQRKKTTELPAEDTALKAEKNISIQFVTEINNLRSTIEMQRTQLNKNRIDKTQLNWKVSTLEDKLHKLRRELKTLKSDLESALSEGEAEELRKKLTQALDNEMIRGMKNQGLSSAAPAPASHSGPLPSAAIVPGKNTRGACGDDSERSAKKPKPETR